MDKKKRPAAKQADKEQGPLEPPLPESMVAPQDEIRAITVRLRRVAEEYIQSHEGLDQSIGGFCIAVSLALKRNVPTGLRQLRYEISVAQWL